MFQTSSNLNVVIIGGGVAGMTTAVLLSEIPGLSVTLLEAESKLGGIFRTSFTAPGIYYPAKREDMRALDTLLGNTTIVDEFYADLKKVVHFLEEKEVIKNKALMGFDNYHVDGNEKIKNTYGLDLLGSIPKALVQGYAQLKIYLGSDFWYHLTYRILAAFNLVEISDQLKTEVSSCGVNVKYNARVVNVRDGEVETAEGDVYAYDYLVFASGGTGGNPELQKRVYDVDFHTHEYNKINTGIALQTAIDKGWAYNKNIFAWYAEVVELKSGDVGPVLFQPGPAVMTVNREGKRVYNEKRCYNERGRVTLIEKELLLITDKNNLKRNTPNLVPGKYNAYLPSVHEGSYIEASSLYDLTQQVRDQGIMKNISDDFESELWHQWMRYHQFVESGIDLEFQRGNDVGEVLDGGDPSIPPASLLKNKAMAPIDESNLIAIRLLPSTLDTCSGPKVDSSCRVQKPVNPVNIGIEDFEAVGNIFAVGNANEAILGGHYTAPGLPLSSGLVGAHRVYAHLLHVVNSNYYHISEFR